jgi:hypothetical protein
MKRLCFALVAVFLLAACSSGSDDSDPEADRPDLNEPTFTGTIDIMWPAAATTIYSEVLYVAGTLTGADRYTFAVELVTADTSEVLARGLITTAGAWNIRLPLVYSGDPTTATVRAVARNDSEQMFAQVPVQLAGLDQRPDGIFGTISLPADGETISGVIQAEGTISGVTGDAANLILVDDTGEMVASQALTLTNPYLRDAIPWHGDIDTISYSGLAELRLEVTNADGDTMTLVAVSFIITSDDG